MLWLLSIPARASGGGVTTPVGGEFDAQMRDAVGVPTDAPLPVDADSPFWFVVLLGPDGEIGTVPGTLGWWSQVAVPVEPLAPETTYTGEFWYWPPPEYSSSGSAPEPVLGDTVSFTTSEGSAPSPAAPTIASLDRGEWGLYPEPTNSCSGEMVEAREIFLRVQVSANDPLSLLTTHPYDPVLESIGPTSTWVPVEADTTEILATWLETRQAEGPCFVAQLWSASGEGAVSEPFCDRGTGGTTPPPDEVAAEDRPGECGCGTAGAPSAGWGWLSPALLGLGAARRTRLPTISAPGRTAPPRS